VRPAAAERDHDRDHARGERRRPERATPIASSAPPIGAKKGLIGCIVTSNLLVRAATVDASAMREASHHLRPLSTLNAR
jgi:hypothetical protein